MIRGKIRITTRMSPDEWAARITAAIDREPPTYPPPPNWENSKPVIGKATPKQIQLRTRHLTQDESKYLTDFLTRTIDGQKTPQSKQ